MSEDTATDCNVRQLPNSSAGAGERLSPHERMLELKRRAMSSFAPAAVVRGSWIETAYGLGQESCVASVRIEAVRDPSGHLIDLDPALSPPRQSLEAEIVRLRRQLRERDGDIPERILELTRKAARAEAEARERTSDANALYDRLADLVDYVKTEHALEDAEDELERVASRLGRAE